MSEIWERRPVALGDAQLIAWALTEVADAIHQHYHWLGVADAATPMGAMELLSKGIQDGCYLICQAIEQAGATIGEGVSDLKGEKGHE